MASILTDTIDADPMIKDACLVDVLAYPTIARYLIPGQWNWRLQDSAHRNGGRFKPFSAELTQVECVVHANLSCEPLSALDRMYELFNGMFQDIVYDGHKFDTYYFKNHDGEVVLQISVRPKTF